MAGPVSHEKQPRPAGPAKTGPLAAAPTRARYAPALVDDVLRSPGQPLPARTRGLLEPRLGHDFGSVRVHADARAGESARAVHSAAYTVGRHVVFAPGRYEPGTDAGRRLLAHELTHVAQQGGAQADPGAGVPLADARSPHEQAAERTADGLAGGAAEPPVSKARAFGRPVLQREPARVGPVHGYGGLVYDDTFKRLSVIVGAGDTLRSIAGKLLPTFNQATPATAEGGAPIPFTPLTVDQLAQGLLVYNRYYLQVPGMATWKQGLRFPLPIEVDRVTGERTLHPGLVATWAGSFEPAWAPLLDQKPAAVVAPTGDQLRASAESFLKSAPTPLERGTHLSARALTNALEAQPFVDEVFRQLGAGGFDVALQFLDGIVNHQVGVLAGQTPGQQILDTLRRALAAPPSPLTPEQRKSLERARRMLDQTGSFTADDAERVKQIYIAELAQCNCMTAVYKGLKGLYGDEQAKSISSQVNTDSAKVMKATGVDTNHMNRIMETVRSRGKAGPMHVFTYGKAADAWTPDPEATILGMTHPTIPGWYFFGFSLHAAYHSVILAVDKSDPAAPKIFWLDQHTEGFTEEVTGALQDKMKVYAPSYGFAPTKMWQLLPASGTIIELR